MTEIQSVLPLGWAATTLGEIRLDLSQGIVPKQYPDERFELYSVPSFESGSPEILLGKEIGSNKRTVETGTILLCRINPRINRVWLVAEHSPYRKIASTEWIPFFPVHGIVPQYLRYYLSRDDVRDYLAGHVSGVGGSLMRIGPSVIEDYPLPLAPLNEQHRIVDEIDKQFTRLDSGVTTLIRAQNRLKNYRASLLEAACEGRLVPNEAQLARVEGRDCVSADVLVRRNKSEAALVESHLPKEGKRRKQRKSPIPPAMDNLSKLPEGWTWTTLSQVAEIQGGIQKHPRRAPVRNSYPFLRVANVLRGSLDLNEIHHIELFGEELEKYRLKTDDLLIVEGNGSLSEIGRMAIWNGAIENCVHQNHIIRARLLGGILAQYVASYWNSPSGSARVREVASSTSGLYTLSVRKVGRIPIPLPPEAEQARIVAEVQRRLSVIDQVEESTSKNGERAERLRHSVLKRAFEGNLVPQDSRDQGADVLLKRNHVEGTETKQFKRTGQS